MIATVNKLDVDALMEILTVPRNAFVKQYQKLFELDEVQPGVHRRGHPRGRRSRRWSAAPAPAAPRAILEEVLLHVMYDVPSRDDIGKVIVTEEVVVDDVAPTLVPRESEAKKKKSA